MANFLKKHPYRTLPLAVCGLLVILGCLIAWRIFVKPPAKVQHGQSAQSLQKTASLFVLGQQKLHRKSQRLANGLQNELERQVSPQKLYYNLQRNSHFWGTILYRGKEPILWKGYSLMTSDLLKDSGKKKVHVTTKKDGNVTFWLSRIDFTVRTSKKPQLYHLFTAKRIDQHNALSIGSSKNYSLLQKYSSGKALNKTIVVGQPLPQQYNSYHVLRSLSGDSVGAVVATNGDSHHAGNHWKDMNQLWKGVYILFCLIVIGILFYLWVDDWPTGYSFLFQTAVLGIIWYAFYRMNIAQNWLPVWFSGLSSDALHSYQALFSFFIDGLFFLLFAYTLKRKLKRLKFRFDPNSYFSVMMTSFGIGLVNSVVIAFVFTTCYHLAYHTTIPLLTLHIFPVVGTFLFYLCIGIVFLALANVIHALSLFLLESCEDHYKLVSIICFAGFLVGLLVLSNYGLMRPLFSWCFLISLIYFGIIFLLASISFHQIFDFRQASPLRMAALYSFIIALAGCTVIYQAQKHRLDVDLQKIVYQYNTSNDIQAKHLTKTLLENIHQYYQLKPDSSVTNRLSYLQAQIPSIVNTTLRKSTNLYFYDIQLRNNRDSVLANFSNNLNAPRWVQRFSINRLRIVTRIQHITPEGNKPVVQQPTLEKKNKYQTFYRGWIALFAPRQKTPVAWVLCSIYRDYPTYSKPMRAVINEQYYGSRYHSYLIGEYKNGRLTQNNFLGFRAQYPVYNLLSSSEQQAISDNPTVYYTTQHGRSFYRNILEKQPNKRAIKGSVILPGYQNISFLYFQLSITLLVVGFVLAVIIRWVENREISLFGSHKRFQYRILDSFLLATVVFLILLVFITYLAAGHKNKELVKQQVLEKLTMLKTSVEKTKAVTNGTNHYEAIPLDSLAANLNVDALFYNNRKIESSTAPQIYRQHLLPDVMPYPVYRDLYLNQVREAFSTVKFGNRNLLIGYHSVRSARGKPIGAVAIPTFIQSPTYNQQLLQTTSYLILLYIAVLGVFIIATVFIARQLTKPLEYIRFGLSKISRGELDTTIPVTSRDEIGNLARVYNEMVMRLRKLREELAATERENAWQEMAQQVAHEIKNPLTPMKLNVQHLQRQLANGEYSLQELTQRITEVTQNLTQQINSLSNIASDFSKFSKPLDPEAFKDISVNEIIRSAASLYKNDPKIKIKVEMRAAKQYILGVEDELHRVLINLMKNARESIDDGGTIRLKTYNKENSIFIEVEDDGQGIGEEDKSKIFVPNFSTKSSGTGLGLAICQKVIEAHGGSISFASIEDEGTTFVIKLPLEKSDR
jgi:signal transduction histidine kinase